MSKARCLVIAPRTPWPQDDGGRVVLWQDLLAVAGGFETRLVVMHKPGEPEPAPPPALGALGVQVSFVAHAPPPPFFAIASGTFGRWPYTLARFQSRTFDRGLRAIVHSWRPDLVFINNLHLATYASAFADSVKVLRQQNLEQLWLARYARAARNPAVAAYAGFQARRMRTAEAELCAGMDLVLAMHEDEAAVIRRFAPGVAVEAVPVGASFADAPARARAAEPTLLVIGSFDRKPNSEGATRFLREGWPLVRARMPAARLRIVGRQISPKLAAFARATGAEPVGFVPELAPEFARAWGIVVPVWYGAGVRVKTVEAIAAGVPVACTPLGAEGLQLEAGRHYLEGRSAFDLGVVALELLEHPERAARVAADAHAFLRPHYASETIARRTVELCDAALTAGARRA